VRFRLSANLPQPLAHGRTAVSPNLLRSVCSAHALTFWHAGFACIDLFDDGHSIVAGGSIPSYSDGRDFGLAPRWRRNACSLTRHISACPHHAATPRARTHAIAVQSCKLYTHARRIGGATRNRTRQKTLFALTFLNDRRNALKLLRQVSKRATFARSRSTHHALARTTLHTHHALLLSRLFSTLSSALSLDTHSFCLHSHAFHYMELLRVRAGSLEIWMISQNLIAQRHLWPRLIFLPHSSCVSSSWTSSSYWQNSTRRCAWLTSAF